MLLVVALEVAFQKFNLAIETGPKESKIVLDSLSVSYLCHSISFLLGTVLWACPSLYFSRRNFNLLVVCLFMHINIASCF